MLYTQHKGKDPSPGVCGVRVGGPQVGGARNVRSHKANTELLSESCPLHHAAIIVKAHKRLANNR